MYYVSSRSENNKVQSGINREYYFTKPTTNVVRVVSLYVGNAIVTRFDLYFSSKEIR